MSTWTHARKGKIEGTLLKDDGDWLLIKLQHARLGHGEPNWTGFRTIYTKPGDLQRFRKCLMSKDKDNDSEH